MEYLAPVQGSKVPSVTALPSMGGAPSRAGRLGCTKKQDPSLPSLQRNLGGANVLCGKGYDVVCFKSSNRLDNPERPSIGNIPGGAGAPGGQKAKSYKKACDTNIRTPGLASLSHVKGGHCRQRPY